MATERESRKVSLQGVLAEFRTALEEEIEAARHHASSTAIHLVSGRRVAQIGTHYQYVFSLENALDLPGDAPGDLRVPDSAQPLDVIVVSVEGLTITLSVPKDLGAFVPTARLQSDPTFLMRTLIKRIESLSNTANDVGERIRGILPVSGQPASVELMNDLNDSQLQAVASSLGRNTTFIWGPPGTGKTKTIGTIAEQLYRQNRSVLLVSHTNIAVDQALIHIAEALPEDELEKGKVLRVGDPRDLRLKDKPELLLAKHVEDRFAELTQRREALEQEKAKISAEVKQISRHIEMCEWVVEAEGDLMAMDEELAQIRQMERAVEQAQAEKSRLQKHSAEWALTAGEVEKAKRCMAAIEKLNASVDDLRVQLARAWSLLDAIGLRLAEAKELYDRTTSVGWLTRRWRRMPSPQDQLSVVEQLQRKLSQSSLDFDAMKRKLAQAEEKRDALTAIVQEFRAKYGGQPTEVARRIQASFARLSNIGKLAASLARECAERRSRFEERLRGHLSILRYHGLTQQEAGTAEDMLKAVHLSYSCASEEVKGLDVVVLRAKRKRLNAQIASTDAEIRAIEDKRKHVEELVIADATLIATTLTRSYLRDDIQTRRFDTVILDEASMAPVPALWVAASLADENAVVVGDFKQLPPIVVSKHDLAQKWLGRDIFHVADLTNPETAPEYFVTLRRQYRMHPQVSRVANTFFYDGLLEDDKKVSDANSERTLNEWYNASWGHDEPVLLVDTGSLGAWVTSVPRRRNSSRLNFMSATVCVDIVQQLLRNDRPQLLEGERPRILMVCPYHAHAQLLTLLFREHNLGPDGKRDVLAGTVHSFQGSEADVVILDLVNDEPHWRVRMFNPKYDRGVKRLLNVAVTRARRRLIVVGNFDYIASKAKKAFLGRELIPFLRKHYPCVDACELVPAGLAARTAEGQILAFGEDVDLSAEHIIGKGERFDALFIRDLDAARSRIVIYATLLTSHRLGIIGPHMQAAVERGVQVYVITRAWSDRKKRELSQYARLEDKLWKLGVHVLHKRGMHEKLIFIDEDIVWTDSLNPLSFTGESQETFERRKSRRIFQAYVKLQRLEALITGYDRGTPTCPICGHEKVVSEGKGRAKFDPWYWRCENPDCGYQHGIDEPPLEGDVIKCRTCGGDVEYGKWGGKPSWRCLQNRRHRQRIQPAHLRLPKMRALIPSRELRRLDDEFHLPAQHKRRTGRGHQTVLFDDKPELR